jgi:indole-3-glycerol phosphate synthase
LYDSRRIPEAQAELSWRPPGGTLGTLIAEARWRVAALRQRASELDRLVAHAPAPPSFSAALLSDDVDIIAEIKRSSPSKGSLDTTIDAAEQAARFEQGGAAAISVLTEPRHFSGRVEDLTEARRGCALPLLRKDFHIDPLQLLEARAAGASAVLIIARALPSESVTRLVKFAASLALEALVECRDERELDLALDAGALLIGVNSRNLETLEVDPGLFDRLIHRIPPGKIAIAESGIASVQDVRAAADAGADAVLVGSALSTSPDAATLVRSLIGVPRQPRD